MSSISNANNAVVIHDAAAERWLRFWQPRRLIQARRLGEVAVALAQVEAAVQEERLFAAGFVSYEAGPAFDPALQVHEDDGPLPLLWFGLYDEPEILDWPPAVGESARPPSGWTATVTQREHRLAIERIKEHIAAGDTYQVNFTYRLRAPFAGDTWAWFIDLVQAQQAQYGAFINTADWAICSASPELFFRLDGTRLASMPMKGTAPRGLTLAEDEGLAGWLARSKKNQAENVMIVDMVRNDMGRVARFGSVTVSRLFAIEKYPTVWQMTSTVTAETEAGLGDLFAALFPAASITGAPKARTMTIIRELERTPRRIYTGSIGFVSPAGQAQFNVAIRTALVDKLAGQAEYGVGGGIVWDSTDRDEFEESRTKARILSQPRPDFALLETLLWTEEGGFYLLDRHLQRLADSATYFSVELDRDAAEKALVALADELRGRAYKVRLLVAQDGGIVCQAEALPDEAAGRRRVCLARAPVDPADPFLYHKTTNRGVYRQALADFPGYDDVLLWNGRGEITESCIANVAARLDGEWLTPPVGCGLLAGTLRGELLAQGELQERVLAIDDLRRCDALHLLNSLRGRWAVQVDWNPMSD